MNPITESDLNAIRDRSSLFAFLREHLGWQVDPDDAFTYEVPVEAGRLPENASVSRIVPFGSNDPFLIILVEFQGGFLRGQLREILRQIREQIRKRAAYEGRALDEILFLCAINDYNGFRWARFLQRPQGVPLLQTFGWDRNDSAIRTLCEFNLPALRMPAKNLQGEYDWQTARDRWRSAWDVERFTHAFFQKYRELFHQAEERITGFGENTDARRLFTQKLFNRLLFIRFLEKKGWLRFQGQNDYLRALWQDYQDKNTQNSPFHRERLKLLFFSGLNNPQEQNQHSINQGGMLRELIGDVPYLNGGLFEAEASDQNDEVNVPDSAIQPLIDELLYRYNFTVTESTPLDIEVAVDPEMLGKVFEELVTGRHESGSFYTPRPVVAFMCREALKGYLQTACSNETADALAQFVDNRETDGLRNPETVLDALKAVKACDPACGSGAYLLGLMQELVELRRALFQQKRIDSEALFDKKLEIIQNNLYGVDIDAFAVNIARLRLWLSLVVDDERNPLEDPAISVALPNLDFKIEQGDSLIAPDPQARGSSFDTEVIRQYAEMKAAYLMAHTASEKQTLRKEIDKLSQEIRDWLPDHSSADVFDWRVEFAEVFGEGGFDIVLANPPYVRQEKIVHKDVLLTRYRDAADGKSDLYVYFYARALQLLKPKGMHVFICSNSWLDVGFGGKLQGFLLQNAHVAAIYDSALERQFASADVNTIISLIRKGAPDDHAETRFISLREAFDESVLNPAAQRIASRTRAQLLAEGSAPNGNYTGNKWGGIYLRAPDIYFTIMEKGRDKLVRLGDIAEVRRGFTTGANEFFYLEPVGKSVAEVAALANNDQARSQPIRVRNAAGWEGEIEAEFLQPVIKSPREIRKLRVGLDDLKYLLFLRSARPNDPTTPLPPLAKAYIQWGESQGYQDRSSCSGRQRWWDLGARFAAKVNCNYLIDDRMRFYYSSIGVFVSDNFQELRGIEENDAAICSVPITQIFCELGGRTPFGGGLLKVQTYEVENIFLLNSDTLSPSQQTTLLSAFESMANRDIQNIFEELGLPRPNRDYGNIDPADVSLDRVLPDRRALDTVVFEALGLTEAEQLEVYRAVVALVKGRLVKARSVS
ncbi:MAG: N-6 DNA methylase [Fimbriimonadia bacterium]|nr:N-6 DNA methylase [Fimbriimonadia bacterium]